MTFKSGFANEDSAVRWVRAPGPLRQVTGFSYQEFSNLEHPLALKGDPFGAGSENKVSYWAEFLMPEHATALAWYDHPFFGKWPAITRNHFGSGTLTYEGTYLSDELQRRVVLDVLQHADLTGPDQSLPAAGSRETRHEPLQQARSLLPELLRHRAAVYLSVCGRSRPADRASHCSR